MDLFQGTKQDVVPGLAEATAPEETEKPTLPTKETGPIDYGENNEDLPEEMQHALHDLATQLLDEDAQARREWLKRVTKAHKFYRGEQYIYWHERKGEWVIPSIEEHLKARQPFRFVTNIVRPYGLTLMAALSQSVPKVRFWPQDPQQEDDVATSDAASAMAEHIQRANRMERLVIDESFLLCFDGIVGGYVRWVNDADRFGTRTRPIIEMVEKEVAPASYTCQGCEAKVETEGLCPTCGYPVTAEDMTPAVMAPVPTPVGEETVPNGQVVIDMVGAQHMKLPITAREQKDFGYIAYVTEISAAKVKAVHAHVAEKIGKGDGLGAMNDASERQERLSLASGRRGGAVTGTDPSSSLVTYHRIWFRPWAFGNVKDDRVREALEVQFPTGARVCFSDDTYCEARDESMDDHWRVQHATPGDGQARDGLMWDLMSVQERYNTLKNLQMETYQHGIPTLFMDRDVVNVKAWRDSGSRPGSGIGVRGRAGTPLGNAFHETTPAQVSRQAIEEERNLMGEVAQFLTGAFPALFGGGAINTETASGYAMQRDQAMGRLGMVFRGQREFHAELITIAVEEMKRNMQANDPVRVALMGPEGQLDAKMISLENLRGHYHAYPESDESFPESFSQKKQALVQLLESGSPLVAPAFASPNAMRSMWRAMGIKDFKLPGEEARQRQYRENQDLLKGQPVPGPMVPDPLTGIPVPGPAMSSVPIDDEFDDHAVHYATIKEWIDSAAGDAQKLMNPAGYENVRLHGLAHAAAMQRKLVEQAQMALVTGGAPAPTEAQIPPTEEGQAPQSTESEAQPS